MVSNKHKKEKHQSRKSGSNGNSQLSTKSMSEKDIAMEFASLIHKKFDRLIKASVLFGSQAKDTATPSSDIDIVIVVDDVTVPWDQELIAWYREELGKVIQGRDYGRELHINTVKLSTWWQDMIRGDPVIINMLRYGEALIDIGGFFNPLKSLLIQGKIKSTPEAVYSALQRAPSHLARSKTALLGAIEGAYWSMVDSAQAALITAGKMPPSPEHIPELLKMTFVDPNLLKMGFVNAFKDLHIIHKSITHGKINSIKGAEIDNWQQTAERFMSEMVRLIDLLLEAKKGN